MKKNIIFFYFTLNALVATSQTLGGYTINDFLISAIHPYGCSSNYVLGLPDDSTWVNFYGGEVMTGEFGASWANAIGDELLLETSYHPDNYDVRLLLATGSFSSSHAVQEADWVQISDTTWIHLFAECYDGTYSVERYILPLDFESDFGLNASDVVVGIEITFLETPGFPDLAGVYIVQEPPCNINFGSDATLC
jgi:hypothetical protein